VEKLRLRRIKELQSSITARTRKIKYVYVRVRLRCLDSIDRSIGTEQ